jgi:hypothetical protein
MNERKLTEKQIEQLFAVCEKYEVRYYDVQIELVDHIACKIEAMWRTEPQLSFDEALFSVLKEFGVDPLFHASYRSLLDSPFPKSIFNSPSFFEEIKKSKEKELVQKYTRIQRKYMAEFFKLPKIILTSALTFILYFILQHSSNNIKASLWLVSIYSVILLLFLFVFYPESLRLEPISCKSFLLFKHYKEKKWYTLISFWGVLNLLSVFSSHKKEINLQVGNLLFSLFLSLFIISSVVMAIYIPRRIKEDFTHEFPQFVKS